MAFRFLIGLTAVFACASPAKAQTAAPATEALPSIPYEITIEGIDGAALSEGMADRIRQELDLEKKREGGTPSLAVLESRMARDKGRIEEVLKAYGYYDGVAQLVITREAPPALVRIVVSPGPLYRIGRFDVVWQGAQPTELPETVTQDLPASGRNIVAGGDRLLAALKSDGYYDAEMVERRAVLDRNAGRVDVTITIASGGVVTIGPVSATGMQTIPERRIVRLSKLEVGELLTTEELRDAEDELLASGLFNEARADAVGRDPARRIQLTVEERLQRTISGAIKWSMQDGFAIEAAWEHRNIFGDAEKLRTALTVGQQRQALEVSYREYDFLIEDYTLLSTFEISAEDVDGSRYQQAALIGTMETEIYDDIILRFGGSVEYVRDETGDFGGDFALIGLRGEVSLDRANDLLDPTEGYRAALRINPYVGFGDDVRQFTVIEAVGSVYYPLSDDFVVAARARIGSIVGADRDDIPLPKRFFAGGGGSIRGYGYKRAGPIDIEDRPVGGSSVIELNGELRYRISEDFGAVVFVDAGGAFPTLLPEEDNDFFVGAGVGVRYYSPIGPVRLDLAMPLNARDGDSGFQIYVSIGQAF